MDLEWNGGAREDGASGVRLGAHRKRSQMPHSESRGSSEICTGQVTRRSKEKLTTTGSQGSTSPTTNHLELPGHWCE